METVARSALFRPELVEPPATPAASAPARTLAATAKYALSQDGRKASLLAGGNGRAVQQVEIHVPANRLHLVSVNGKGVARLKLRPRYEVHADQRLVCIDEWPTYDSPPAPEDLLRDAARNHQLERAYHAERTVARTKRWDAERVRRTEVALAFLQDDTQRAIIHPSPTSTRCYLATRFGHMEFHVKRDEGPARDVAPEAYRRFRADVQAARERGAREQAEGLKMHEARKHAMAAWVAEHGTDEQRARQGAGLLPLHEVLDAMADEAFRALADRPRYTRNGAALVHAHVQQWTGRAVDVVGPNDFLVVGHPARSASPRQWARLQAIQAAVPDAVVTLHQREFIWRRDPGVPRFTRLTVVVVRKQGPITLRREYLLVDDELDQDSQTTNTEGASMTHA
jgi:hypothetical protein